MIVYFLFYGLVMFGSYISSERIRYRNFIFFLFAFLLVVFVGFRTAGVDRDSLNYLDFFKNVESPSQYFVDYQSNYFSEPAYYLIPSLFRMIGLGEWATFLAFALLAILLKMKAILRLTDFVFLSLLLYCSHLLFLHDFTQIRSGVASGVLLMAIPEIVNRRFAKFLLWVLFACCFHYSALIFLPLFFLLPTRINKVFYLSILFIPYVLYFLGINIFTFMEKLHLGVLSEKMQIYNDLLSQGEFSDINVFNILTLAQLTISVLFIIKAEKLVGENKYVIVLTKINVLSVVAFVLLSGIPVFAFRVSGILEIVQIILIPLLIYVLKPSYVAVIIVFLLSVYMFFNDIVRVGYLKSYFSL